MQIRHSFQFAAAIVLPVLFTIALGIITFDLVCFSHDSLHHQHVVCVDLEYGTYTKEQIEMFESFVPEPGLGTKTPPPAGPALGPVSDVVTIVVDFKEPGEPDTTDSIGNTVGPFDVTAYGFEADEFDLVKDAVMAELQEDYFDELAGTVANKDGAMLNVNIIEGNIGTPPPGVSEYYFVQVGSGLKGPFIFALGVARGSAIRNVFGDGPNGETVVGDVVSSVFTDNIQGIGGLTPQNALTSGNLTFTTNAIVGTLAHEIGHTVSLSHINTNNSVQRTPGVAPIMGTGAIDLPNQLRITDRQFSLTGLNEQSDNDSEFHVLQLVFALGLTETNETPQKTILGADDFDGEQNFLNRTLSPDLSGNRNPGAFLDSDFDVFGIVDRTVNSGFSDDTLIATDMQGLLPSTVTDQFLGYADLSNPNNPSGTASLQYEIDITDAENLELSIDMAARGNFEANDRTIIMASIDGGPPQNLFSVFVNTGAAWEYFYEDGSSETFDDPMTANGVIIDNNFETYTSCIVGTGSTLTLDFSFTSNGGTEQVAFDNMMVRGDLPDMFVLGDVNCDGVVNLLDVEAFIDAISNDVLDPKADLNQDGVDNLLDVEGFVALVSG